MQGVSKVSLPQTDESIQPISSTGKNSRLGLRSGAPPPPLRQRGKGKATANGQGSGAATRAYGDAATKNRFRPPAVSPALSTLTRNEPT